MFIQANIALKAMLLSVLHKYIALNLRYCTVLQADVAFKFILFGV